MDLKKNSGEERRRAHDLFPALWLNDLFMQRVEEDGLWTLFDPYDCGELTKLHGEAFSKRYVELEQNEELFKEKVKAKVLWKKILKGEAFWFMGMCITAKKTQRFKFYAS